MDFNDLPPEERKRMLVALDQDPRYTRSRNILLLVSLVVTLCLSGVGWLVMKNVMTLWVSVVAICVCVAMYLFFLVRVVRTKKATLGRWMAQGVVRKVKRKERKNEKRKSG